MRSDPGEPQAIVQRAEPLRMRPHSASGRAGGTPPTVGRRRRAPHGPGSNRARLPVRATVVLAYKPPGGARKGTGRPPRQMQYCLPGQGGKSGGPRPAGGGQPARREPARRVQWAPGNGIRPGARPTPARPPARRALHSAAPPPAAPAHPPPRAHAPAGSGDGRAPPRPAPTQPSRRPACEEGSMWPRPARTCARACHACVCACVCARVV